MRMLLAVTLVAVALAMLGGSAAASEIVTSFDPAAGEFPEGIAVDRQGRIYVGIAPLGEIRRLSDDGAWTTIHRFAPGDSGLAVLGLAADRHDTIYAAVPSTDPGAHGVWALPAHGDPYRLAGSEQIGFPDGIALDQHGTLYVTDAALGRVWRIRPDHPAESWLADDLLAGTGAVNRLLGEDPPPPLGANGIAYQQGRLLVANTDRKQLVEIPIELDGSPGAPSVLHTFSGERDFLDGAALDAAGNAYLVVGGNRVVRLDGRTGQTTVVADHEHDGITIPASLAFGTRGTSTRTLYVTNFSVPPLVAVAFGPDEPPAPGVVALEVSLPGPPLP
jgi:sugar lactone lactonase YvrE